MLFRSLDSYLSPSVNARVLPHLNNYIDTLNVRRGMVAERFLNAFGNESKFIALLRKILADADISRLMKEASDLDVYMNVLQYTKKDLDAIYDPNATGISHTRLLVARNQNNTQEILVPVSSVDPLTDLPMNQGWSEWQKYKPVRIVDHDSQELSLNLYQDQIIFKQDYPTRIVITIDVVALVLQYINFVKQDTLGTYQVEYLHKNVIVHLLSDLQNIWLGNTYHKLVTTQDLDSLNHIDINQIMQDHWYGYVGVEFPTAVKEIVSYIQNVKDGSVKPDVFIKSLRMSNSCVVTYLQVLLETTYIDTLRQYDWMEYLRDRRWLALMYDTFDLVPDFVGTKTIKTSLRRDVPILAATRFWNNCHDLKTRQFIQDDIQHWIEKLD